MNIETGYVDPGGRDCGDELGDGFDMNILPFVKHRQWEPVV